MQINKIFSGKRLTICLSSALLILLIAVWGCKNKPSHNKNRKPVSQPSAITNTSSPLDLIGDFLEASLNGNTEKVRGMVSQGMAVNTTDEQNRTALMMAAYNGHTDIVKYLLYKGAEVDALDNAGRTALIYASSGPFPETVKVLLKHKADPNIIAKGDGWTALMYAAAEGQLEVVKVLLEHGADPAIKEVDGDDAQSFARKNGHMDVVGYLQSHRAKK